METVNQLATYYAKNQVGLIDEEQGLEAAYLAGYNAAQPKWVDLLKKAFEAGEQYSYGLERGPDYENFDTWIARNIPSADI